MTEYHKDDSSTYLSYTFATSSAAGDWSTTYYSGGTKIFTRPIFTDELNKGDLIVFTGEEFDKKEKGMKVKGINADKIKAPILKGLINIGLVGPTLRVLAVGTGHQVSTYFPNASHYGVSVTSRTDPLARQPSGLSKASSYHTVVIFYRLDDAEELIQKANIVWESLTALVPKHVYNDKSGDKMRSQIIIFSKKMNVDELLDLVTYAGAKSAWELQLEGIEGVCIAASLLEK